MEGGKVIIPVELETIGFEHQIDKAIDDLEEFSRMYEKTKESEPYKGQEEDLRQLGIEMEKPKHI